MDAYTYNSTEQMVPQKKKRVGLCVLLILLAVIFLLSAAAVALYKPVKYIRAVILYEGRYFEEAVVAFEDLSGYKKADIYANHCRYGIAEYALWTGHYDEAIAGFSALGTFEDSPTRVSECYYDQGVRALSDGEYETAIGHFENAGAYHDAAEYIQISIYEWGHNLFLEGSYEEADQIFARLNGQYPEYGAPHFASLMAASEYFDGRLQSMTAEFTCYVGNVPYAYYDDMERMTSVFANYLPNRSCVLGYDWQTGKLSVEANYYPSDLILYAWRTGDESVLQSEEKQVLEQALALVEQARSETENALELELWLHDWLCRNVVYSNPDMDIPEEAFLQLRELTCVGAMVDGVANCQGYTDAFYLLGTMAGMQVRKMYGEAEEGHTWNTIYLNDSWYIVDVTFDDIDGQDAEAKHYIWFNCPFDPEERQIDGSADVLPGLAREEDWSVTYYGQQDAVFTDVGEAVYYLLRQHAAQGTGWTYAVVEGAQADSDDFYAAISKYMSRVGLWSVRWHESIEHINGNTYFSIYWE